MPGGDVTGFQPYEQALSHSTQAYSLGWYVAAPLALILSPRKCAATFRRANGPEVYQHGVKPHE